LLRQPAIDALRRPGVARKPQLAWAQAWAL